MLSNTLNCQRSSNRMPIHLPNQNYLHLESSLDEGVEFIGLINKYGRIIEAHYKSQIPLPVKKNEMLFMETLLSASLQRDFDEDFGAVAFMITERKNLKFASIPWGSELILIIMQKNCDHYPIIEKIISINTLNSEASTPEVL